MTTQRMMGAGLLNNGISGAWPAKSSAVSSGLLEFPKPLVKLDLAPTIDFGIPVKPAKFSLGSGDSISGGSLINLSPTYGPTFGGYGGNLPVCTPSRAGILTGGSSGSVAEQPEEGNPGDVLVAVVIALLMFWAMASRIL